MLAGKYRFHSRGGVRYVLSKGKSIRNQDITVVFAPNSRGRQRFAVVVSKKVLKPAVGRNRIRRRIYEAIRLNKPADAVATDFIFIINSRDILTVSFDDLTSRISSLFDQIVLQ